MENNTLFNPLIDIYQFIYGFSVLPLIKIKWV